MGWTERRESCENIRKLEKERIRNNHQKHFTEIKEIVNILQMATVQVINIFNDKKSSKNAARVMAKTEIVNFVVFFYFEH